MSNIDRINYRVGLYQLVSGFDGEVVPGYWHTVMLDGEPFKEEVGRTLGVVGKNYKIKQNPDVFGGLEGRFGPMTECGTMRRGAIAWAMYKLKITTHSCQPRVLVVNSFDGKTPRGRAFPMALGMDAFWWFIPSAGVKLSDKDAKTTLEITLGTFDDMLTLRTNRKGIMADNIIEQFTRFDNLSYRVTRREPDLWAARLYSNWFGVSAGLKRAAWDNHTH